MSRATSILIGLGLLASLGGWTCGETGVEVKLDILGFTEIIRPDLQELTLEQVVGSDPLFVNDGSRLDAPLSRMTLPNQSGHLRQSNCFYTAASRPTVSWEVVARGIDASTKDGDSIEITSQSIGFCASQPGEVTDIYSRKIVKTEDETTLLYPVDLFDQNMATFGGKAITVALSICPEGPKDAQDSCSQLNDRCEHRDLRLLCQAEIHDADSEDGIPFNEIDCFKNCILPDSASLQTYYDADATYGIRIAPFDDLSSPGPIGQTETPQQVLANLKVVDSTRVLSRPMISIGAVSSLNTWSWTVRELQGEGGLVWEENFSPYLFVTRVRFFTQTQSPDGVAKTYLRPDLFRVNGQPCATTAENQAIILDVCGLAYTPTYRLGNPEQYKRNAVWEAGFAASNPAAPPAGSEIFIEFEVVEADLKDALLNLDVVAQPGAIHFGSLPVGTPATQKLAIVNGGTQTVDLRSVTIASNNNTASHYSLNSVTYPRVIPAGGQLDLEVGVNPRLNTGAATILAEFRVGSATRTLRVRAYVQPVDPSLGPAQADAVTRSIDFSRGDALAAVVGAPDHAFKRKAILANNGYQDLELLNYRIEGSNASAFQIIDVETSGVVSGTSIRQIHAGGYADLVVLYDHTRVTAGSGPHQATLKVDTNDPNRPLVEIPIRGDYR